MERHFEDSRIGDLKARLARGELTRRDFLDSMVGLGFSASAARRTLGNWNVNRGADGPSLEEKTFRITTYRLYLGDKMLVTVGGEAIAARAIIECKGENQEQLTLHFLSTDRSGEANNSDKHGNTTDISSNKALGNMFLPAQQYTWYVDLLRNEDPVYATLDGSLPLNNRVWCGETVGDGELKDLVG